MEEIIISKKRKKEILKNLQHVNKMYEEGLENAKLNSLQKKAAKTAHKHLHELINYIENGGESNI